MTKQSFISELKNALAGVSSNTRDEILSDISEHFTEGIAQGLSEEEICKSLGQPGTIAAQVLEEMGSYSQESGYQQAQYTGDIDQTFTGVNNLDIQLDASSLNFLPSPTGEFRVTVKGNNTEYCTLENINGTLQIIQRVKRRLFGFSFNWNGKSDKTTVYIPAQFMGEIKARASAGGINATDTSGQLDVKTSAGGVTIENHRCRTIRAFSSAGGVTVRLASEHVETADIGTSAGGLTFEAASVGPLRLNSSAGSVHAHVGKLGGDTDISSSAGSVKLAAKEVAGNIRLNSSAGSIKVNLPYDVNCRINVKKPSIGSLTNQLAGNPQSPYELRASSSVGSITLKPL